MINFGAFIIRSSSSIIFKRMVIALPRRIAALMPPALLVASMGVASGCALLQPIDKYHEKPTVDRQRGIYLRADFEDRESWYEQWGQKREPDNCDVIDRDAPSTRFKPLHGRALRITIRKGSNLGSDLRFHFAEERESQPESMHLAYSLRFADDFKPVLGGKMPGFSGTYGVAGWGQRVPDGENGWSARGSFSKPDAHGRITLGSYAYHVHQPKDHGEVWPWLRDGRGTLEPNRWYRIEQFIKLNTPGRNNGILRAWVDGRLAFEKKDVCFRNTRDLRIEDVWMNVYHGGPTPATHDYHLYIDDVVISRSRIKG